MKHGLTLALAGGWEGWVVAAGCWRPQPCPWVFEAHNRGGSTPQPPLLLLSNSLCKCFHHTKDKCRGGVDANIRAIREKKSSGNKRFFEMHTAQCAKLEAVAAAPG